MTTKLVTKCESDDLPYYGRCDLIATITCKKCGKHVCMEHCAYILTDNIELETVCSDCYKEAQKNKHHGA